MREGVAVDGTRPAVAAVTSLPRSYRLTPADRLILLVLACDSFDGVHTAPSYDGLADWTGMLRSSVAEVMRRLAEPTEHRPALIARAETKRGRDRTVWALQLEPSGDTDRIPSGHTDRSAMPQPSGHADLLVTPQPSGEPSGEPSGHAGLLPIPTPSSPSGDGLHTLRIETASAFEDAWAHWPKKVERKKAQERFTIAAKKVGGPSQLAAMVQRFGDAYAATTQQQFVPGLAVWLGQERWTDELPRPRQQDRRQLSRTEQNILLTLQMEERDRAREEAAQAHEQPALTTLRIWEDAS